MGRGVQGGTRGKPARLCDGRVDVRGGRVRVRGGREHARVVGMAAGRRVFARGLGRFLHRARRGGIRVRGASGWSSTVVLTDAPGDSRSCRVRATSGEAYEDGDVLRVVGRLDSLGDTDWDRSRFMKGEVGSLDVRAVLACEEGADKTPLGALRAAAIQCIEPSRGAANAMLAGTVCGRVTELADEDAYAAFTRCGLTHLVAVSGSHLAYIAALVEAVLRRSRAGRGLRKAILLAAMGSYVVLSGGRAVGHALGVHGGHGHRGATRRAPRARPLGAQPHRLAAGRARPRRRVRSGVSALRDERSVHNGLRAVCDVYLGAASRAGAPCRTALPDAGRAVGDVAPDHTRVRRGLVDRSRGEPRREKWSRWRPPCRWRRPCSAPRFRSFWGTWAF